jgi:hypothetical protein
MAKRERRITANVSKRKEVLKGSKNKMEGYVKKLSLVVFFMLCGFSLDFIHAAEDKENMLCTPRHKSELNKAFMHAARARKSVTKDNGAYIALPKRQMNVDFMNVAHEIMPVTKDGISYIVLPKNSSGCFIIKQATQHPKGSVIVGELYRGTEKTEERGLGELKDVVNKVIKFDKPTIFKSNFEFRLFALYKDPKTGDETPEADIGKVIKVWVLEKNECKLVEREQKIAHVDSYRPFFFKRSLSWQDGLKIAAIAAGVGASLVATTGAIGYRIHENTQEEEWKMHKQRVQEIESGQNSNRSWSAWDKYGGDALSTMNELLRMEMLFHRW